MTRISADSAGLLRLAMQRLEIRRAWILSDPAILAYLDEAGQWAGFSGIGLVEAERRIGDQRSVEVRHYLLSAPLDAATFAGIVRRHCGIEILWRHFRREVAHCELFGTMAALLVAATDFFARYNREPHKLLSVIGSNAAKAT